MIGTITDISGIVGKALGDKAKSSLAALYPRDFEVYMCALELVSPYNESIDYFSFPVMPKSITKNETEATSVQVSLSGITVFNKKGFTPNELTISGDFGRSFKLLEHEQTETATFRAFTYSIDNGYYNSTDVINFSPQKVSSFPKNIKSGFGCIKILQSFIEKAKSYNRETKTFRLYFYNLALGESYLVIPTKNPLVFSQSEQTSNMIWQYTLNLSIIADLNDVTYYDGQKKASMFKTGYSLDSGTVLKNINAGKSIIKNMISKI